MFTHEMLVGSIGRSERAVVSLDVDQRERVNSSAILNDVMELCQWQEWKSLAQASGLIDLGTAMWFFHALKSVDHFNGLPLGQRLTAMIVMKHLALALRYGAKEQAVAL